MLRDNTTVEDPRLDRIVQFDEASRAYPICAALGASQQQPVTKQWTIPQTEPVLNQGREGACVGFGVTNELRFRPHPIKGLNETFARQRIYWPAQNIDPWPGGSYPGAAPVYEGTSVLAGVQTAASLGYYSEYRWAFSEPELALGISHQGPAIIGVPWYSGMMQIKDKTNPIITPTGTVQGGHCVLVMGINVNESFYQIYNSWGPGWGQRGRAYLSRAHMAKLLSERGDACVITGRLTPSLSPTV